MHLGLIAYEQSTINTNALLPTAFGRPIYGAIVLGLIAFGPTFQVCKHLSLLAYWPNTIDTIALWSNASGPPIYCKIALKPHCIWTHISIMNAFGPDSIWAECY